VSVDLPARTHRGKQASRALGAAPTTPQDQNRVIDVDI